MPQKPHYLRFASLALALTGFIFLVLPFLVHLIWPTAGSFDPGTLNALALGAVLFVATVHLGFFAYRHLFPRFHAYQRECLEGEGKLFENLTDELREPLYHKPTFAPSHERLNLLIERRKVAQFQFTIRCVRYFFCFSALVFLLWLALQLLKVAMVAVPGSGPSI